MAADATPVRKMPLGGSRPANGEELANFFDHLARDLDEVEFFRAEHMRPVMWQNMRNIFLRAELTEQEVRTLHGALAPLSGRRQGRLGSPHLRLGRRLNRSRGLPAQSTAFPPPDGALPAVALHQRFAPPATAP